MISITNLKEVQRADDKIMTMIEIDKDDRVYEEKVADKIRNLLNKELSIIADVEVR